MDLHKILGRKILSCTSSLFNFKTNCLLNILKFLAKTGRMLEPPTSNSITNAIKRLQDVGAFDSEHMLTPLGHHLAALPVNVRIGKLIIFGAIFCCLDSALTIAACLSHKSPFSIPFDKRHEIDPKKEFFSVNSDQLTILKVYKVKLFLRIDSIIIQLIFMYIILHNLCFYRNG